MLKFPSGLEIRTCALAISCYNMPIVVFRPSQAPALMTKHVIAHLDEIKPGRRKIVDVEGRAIGLFNINGEYFAVRDRCPHQGGSLCSGQLWGPVHAPAGSTHPFRETAALLRCPLHAWEFDLRTGQSWFDEDRQGKRRFPASLAPAEADLQQGPYVAQTYPVSIEGDDILIDV
jgi:nitrite reductase/ring-hydroxylating ferredoxin subunit